MSKIQVDTERILDASKEIVDVSIRVKEIKAKISGIHFTGSFGGAYRGIINARLKEILKEISEEAVKADSMADALQQIAEKYRETEKALLFDQVSSATRSHGNADDSEIGTDKRNVFQKFWDWLTRKEPDNYDTTTLEQEKAADQAMRGELYLILQDKKYSPEHWDRASIEERKQILQDYMDKVVEVYGLQDVKPEINWDSNLPYTGQSVTMGQYNNQTQKVSINENVLTDSIATWDSYALLGTVGHELRHAYQHEAISHPTRFMVTQDTIDKWDENFDNYISSSIDYHAYRNQIVERDARSFEVKRNGSYSS